MHIGSLFQPCFNLMGLPCSRAQHPQVEDVASSKLKPAEGNENLSSSSPRALIQSRASCSTSITEQSKSFTSNTMASFRQEDVGSYGLARQRSRGPFPHPQCWDFAEGSVNTGAALPTLLSANPGEPHPTKRAQASSPAWDAEAGTCVVAPRWGDVTVSSSKCWLLVSILSCVGVVSGGFPQPDFKILKFTWLFLKS